MEIGKGTREEIVKWNRMTALRFQTGWKHQTSPSSLRDKNKTKKVLHCDVLMKAFNFSLLSDLIFFFSFFFFFFLNAGHPCFRAFRRSRVPSLAVIDQVDSS